MNSCYGARYSSGPYSKYDQIASRKEEEKRDQLLQKVRELEEATKELIIAINDSNFCTTCSDEFGTLACSECPWHQAKVRAIRLLAKEEEAE